VSSRLIERKEVENTHGFTGTPEVVTDKVRPKNSKIILLARLK
jgi:hypothetical protein